MKLNDIEKKFFALLRLSLSATATVDDDTAKTLKEIRPDDWAELFRMSVRQTLAGVMFSGVERLEASLRPDRDLIIRWFALSEQIKRENRVADVVAVKALKRLTADGFRCCLLKGQGNALCYPDPRRRQSGDVDVWTDCDEQRALRYAARGGDVPEFYYHHVELPPIGRSPVELHYRPAFLQNFRHNRRLQSFFRQCADEQFSHLVSLPDEAGTVAVPTPSFNRIFLLAHTVNHFGHEGVGLRQVVDYYYVLRQGFSQEEKTADERLLRRVGMLRFARGMMYIMRAFFGLEEQFLLVDEDRQMGEAILHEALCGGNFGHYDKRAYAGTNAGRTAKNFFRLLRDLRLCRYYPSEMLAEPLFRLWHYAWRQRQKHLLKK